MLLIEQLNALCAADKFMYDVFPQKDRKHITQGTHNKFRQAQRYNIDDSITEAAMTLAQQHPDILTGMLKRARAPYPTIWMEWNNKFKILCCGSEPADDAPERVGAIIEQIHETKPIFRMTSYTILNENGRWVANTALLSILYDLDQPFAEDSKEMKDARFVSEYSGISLDLIRVSMLGTSLNHPNGGVAIYTPDTFIENGEIVYSKKGLFDLSRHALRIINPLQASKEVVWWTFCGKPQERRSRLRSCLGKGNGHQGPLRPL